MKLQFSSLALFLAASVQAHSWLECVNTDVQNYDECKANPAIDPKEVCNGFPRNKVDNGNWIAESSNYLWNLNGDSNPNGLACRGSQTNNYPPGVPMTTARPGQTLRMRHWGNGHSRWDMGFPLNRDPGVVRVYWGGRKDRELKSKSDLVEANWIPGAQANFSGDAVILIEGNNMKEKANYFSFTLPNNMANGRHPMVWTWAWDRAVGDGANSGSGYNNQFINSYSTCFDIQIEGSSYNEDPYAPPPSSPSTPPNSVCSTGSCNKGGMASYPCSGANCPPCWYAQNNGYNCFEYKDGKCPFGGAYDCKTNTQTRRALRFERSPFEDS